MRGTSAATQVIAGRRKRFPNNDTVIHLADPLIDKAFRRHGIKIEVTPPETNTDILKKSRYIIRQTNEENVDEKSVTSALRSLGIPINALRNAVEQRGAGVRPDIAWSRAYARWRVPAATMVEILRIAGEEYPEVAAQNDKALLNAIKFHPLPEGAHVRSPRKGMDNAEIRREGNGDIVIEKIRNGTRRESLFSPEQARGVAREEYGPWVVIVDAAVMDRAIESLRGPAR